MKTIHKKYEIKTPLKKVWQCLIDPKEIEAWGGGPNVKMDDKIGTKFSLWGGDIHGTNTKVTAQKELVQDWYGGDWPKASVVTFRLSQKGTTTVLELIHEGVPEDQVKDFDDGWDDYYVGPMKEYLEDGK